MEKLFGLVAQRSEELFVFQSSGPRKRGTRSKRRGTLIWNISFKRRGETGGRVCKIEMFSCHTDSCTLAYFCSGLLCTCASLPNHSSGITFPCLSKLHTFCSTVPNFCCGIHYLLFHVLSVWVTLHTSICFSSPPCYN